MHSRLCERFDGKMTLDSDLLVTNACAMMLKNTFYDVLFIFCVCPQIDVEVSLIKIDYWFTNNFSNHDIKCGNDSNGMK